MKKKELTNIRSKKIQDLVKMVVEKKKEATMVYSKMKAGQEKNLKKGKNLKKDIAQIMTIIKERELSEKQESKEKKEGEK